MKEVSCRSQQVQTPIVYRHALVVWTNNLKKSIVVLVVIVVEFFLFFESKTTSSSLSSAFPTPIYNAGECDNQEKALFILSICYTVCWHIRYCICFEAFSFVFHTTVLYNKTNNPCTTAHYYINTNLWY